MACVLAIIFSIAVACDTNNLSPDPVLLESAQARVSAKDNPTTISKKSYKDQIKYREENLKVLAESILNLAKDPEFRKLVYSEIDKKFDDDDDVLIETLFASNLITNANDESLLTRYTKHPDVRNSLQAFKGIENEKNKKLDNYFPHLYIPYYENFKGKTDLNKPLVIVPWDGNEEVEQATGFILKEGKFQVLEFPVNQKYCSENEVWVISLNERVDQNGNYKKPRIAPVAQARMAYTSVNGMMYQFKLACNFESVFSGNNDIYIQGNSAFFNGIDPATGNQFLWRVRESDVYSQIINVTSANVGTNYQVNYIFYSNWDPNRPEPGPRGDIFGYVIYEADNWPSGYKYVSVPFGTETFDIGYRSSDNYLDYFSFQMDTLLNNGVTRGSGAGGCYSGGNNSDGRALRYTMGPDYQF